ncbi:EAL domain-containing protein [Phreatobacter stygius]|uniref:EAL domain-containing protein n=2 Tax=Pseudomonadota TaxID=1224 RepID=A0A4D7AQP5_9HYPH|nr:EAL domain-containing protein [Phreatobacter stygius]QCI63299.1 EAL domain-containing protein [Phreatobacter stygius]
MRGSQIAESSGDVLIPVLEQAIDAVVIIDELNNVTFFNTAAEKLWGHSRAEVLGQNVRLLVPAPMRPAHDAQINRNRAGGTDTLVGTTVEVPIERKDGTPVWGSLSLSRITAGGKTLYAAFVKDVTEDVKRREEIYLLSLVADETDRAVIITDVRHRIVYCNRAFTEMFGYQRAEVMGQSPTALLRGQHTDPRALARLNGLAGHQRGLHEEVLGYTKSGKEIWLSATINPILDQAGQFRHAVSVIANITETKQTQVLQQRVLEALANDRPLVEVADLICRQVEAITPGVVCSILRVDAGGLVRPLAGPSLPDHYSQALDGLPIGPDVGSCGTAAHLGVPVQVDDIETSPLWAAYKSLPLPLGLLACWSSPIKLKDGRVAGTFAFYFREKRGPSAWHERLVEACVHLCALAIERHDAKAHIDQLAYYDTLTGLPNRLLLGDKIDQQIAAAAASHKEVALLFLDIDNFKDVNDTLGHSAGDALLIEIARRLQDQLRAGDIVSRLGGDEFVVMLSDCGVAHAAGVAGRILEALALPIRVEAMALPVSASIGISLYPGDGLNKEALLKHADTAMYEAKAAGRGTHRFFSHDMNLIAQERLVLGAALSDALCHGTLQLHYQPQIRTEDDSLHGVEALARWHHPVHGQVPPAKFIALAEETGLVEAVGEWALGEACRQMADWRRRGIDIPTVSVNLSPLHFRNSRLPDLVASALKRNGLEARALTLEITENVMMDDCPETAATVQAVHALGIRLSLDDFGIGYSSLSSITRLPIEELKIDRSFMRDLETDQNARAVASAVIRIGHSLGLNVVAEGVETEAQRRFLQALRCHVLQGFLFAPAQRAGDLESWLARRDVVLSRSRVA